MAKNKSGKSNLSIIQDYVNGERPFIQTGYVPEQKQRKIGEIWEDSKGNKWIQRDGYASNLNEQADTIRAARKRSCCKCNKDLEWGGDHLDTKFHKMTGHCFDCIITEETRLRAIGKFKDYERKKVLMNMLSKCYDVMQGLRDSYNYLKDEKGVVTFQEYVGLKKDMVQEDTWGKIDHKQVGADIRKEYKILAKEAWKIKKEIKSITI